MYQVTFKVVVIIINVDVYVQNICSCLRTNRNGMASLVQYRELGTYLCVVTPHACARGKVIGCVTVVLVVHKILPDINFYKSL